MGFKAEVVGASVDTSGSGNTDVGVKLNGTSLNYSGGGTTFRVADRTCTSSSACHPARAFNKADPAGIGWLTGTTKNQITIVPDDGDYCASHVAITLTVAERSIEVSPEGIDFGNQKRSVLSATQDVTITNDGAAPLTV
ncbi:hypothetical protein, partial [Archangium violaceum]|uniref:hypothetical protein n=1 Tax=Archangium violaceum TaxID=83451 RepID=UPI00136223AF